MYKQGFFVAVNLFIFSVCAIPYCNRPDRSNELVFPCETKSSDVVRVLSYNIRGDSAIDKQYGNAWETRKDSVNFLVQHYQPDIIGFQGMSKHYMSDLNRLFAYYTPIAFDANDESHDAVLFIRSDRFAVKEAQFFYLSGAPSDKSILQQSVLGGKPRIAVYATLFDHHTHKTYVVCCAHFESNGIESRINSAGILTQKLAEKPCNIPIILVGDFNFFVGNSIYAEKSQKAYTILTQNLLVHDVRDLSESHYGPDGTWIGWPYDKHAVPLGTVGERLDGIFVRECCVIQEGVLNLKVKNGTLIGPFEKEFNTMLYPSDHLPIIADVLVQ